MTRSVQPRTPVRARRPWLEVAAPVLREAARYAARRVFSPSERPSSNRGLQTVQQSNAPTGKVYSQHKNKRRYKKVKLSVESLKDEVRLLQKDAKKIFARHRNYETAVAQLQSSINGCAYRDVNLITKESFIDTINQLPTTDHAIPAGGNQLDMTLIPNPAPLEIKSWCEVVIKNNYLYPVDVDCYIIKPRVDTNNTVLTCLSTGMTQLANPAITVYTDINYYPTDSKMFTDHYKILKACPTRRLSAGDEIVESYAEVITFDYKDKINNDLSHRKKYDRYLLVRIQGTVCHDQTDNSFIGISSAKVDMILRRKFTVKYPNDVPIKTQENVSGLNAEVAIPVVGIMSAEKENSL